MGCLCWLPLSIEIDRKLITRDSLGALAATDSHSVFKSHNREDLGVATQAPQLPGTPTAPALGRVQGCWWFIWFWFICIWFVCI